MIQYLVHDASGNVVGYGETNNETLLDPNTIACTADQYANPYAYAIDLTQTPPVIIPAANSILLKQAQEQKSADMQSACKNAIYAGFTSSALGSAYHYPAEDRDQTNLNGCVTQSYYPGNPAGWTISFYCEDATGVWAKRPHTAAQIQQVGSDAINAIQAALNKNDNLQQQITAATTIDAVNAITW